MFSCIRFIKETIQHENKKLFSDTKIQCSVGAFYLCNAFLCKLLNNTNFRNGNPSLNRTSTRLLTGSSCDLPLRGFH